MKASLEMEVAFEESGDFRVTYETVRRQLAVDFDVWLGGKGEIVRVAFSETADDEPWQKSQKQEPHQEDGTAKDYRILHFPPAWIARTTATI
jgi:hypothetical protein